MDYIFNPHHLVREKDPWIVFVIKVKKKKKNNNLGAKIPLLRRFQTQKPALFLIIIT